MASQVFKQWFWDCYDHLGRLLLLNVLLFFALLPVSYYLLLAIVALARAFEGPATVVAVAVLLILASTLFTTVWFAGMLHFGRLSSAEKDPPARAFLAGLRTCGGRALRFLLLWHVVAAILLANLWFYFFGGRLPESLALAGYALGGLCGWLFVLWVAVGMHALPLAARQQRTLRDLVRLGLGLTVKYPGATFSVMAFAATLLVVGALPKLAGILLWGFAAPAMLINSLHDVVLEREEVEEGARQSRTANKPTSWRQIQIEESDAEEHRLRKARYERTLRDILRPWEM